MTMQTRRPGFAECLRRILVPLGPSSPLASRGMALQLAGIPVLASEPRLSGAQVLHLRNRQIGAPRY